MRRLPACLAVAALLAAGCGGDDEGDGSQDTVATKPPTETARTSPQTAPATETTETAKTETVQEPEPETSPEKQPGGAGDEEAIRTEVVLEARGGRIRPTRVRVPPYIGVRVELRTSESAGYTLKVAGRTIRVGDGVSSASTTVGGMRPGESVVARPTGRGNEVVIEASAEPGP